MNTNTDVAIFSDLQLHLDKDVGTRFLKYPIKHIFILSAGLFYKRKDGKIKSSTYCRLLPLLLIYGLLQTAETDVLKFACL